MTSQSAIERKNPPINPGELLELAFRTQGLAFQQFALQIEEGPPETLDPLDIGRPLTSLVQNWSQEPLQLAGVFGKFWQQSLRLQWNGLMNFYGAGGQPVVEPDEDDRRFLDDSWTDHPWFDSLKQSYLLFSDLVNDCFAMDTGLDERDREKIHFFTHQWLKAVAPSNYPATNPVVIKEAVATNGASLVKGYRNFLRDWEQSNGQFRILLSDPEAFKLGENIATTPGAVVYQNDLFQLIQYHPTTGKAFKDPLLVIPPWINKYYIMDLRPDNSIIRYWVDQGHTVFIVSWVNPDENHADVSFEDYMLQGVYAACDAVEQATGEKRINAVGYCIGGTLLAATLAHRKSKGDQRIKSATFFTTLIDFSDPGEIRAFIDEQQVRNMESRMEKKGYLEGTEMASAFSMLRADDLIWNAVVHYYLMGKETIAFDLLHWNGDSTRMPKSMHSFYLRNMYLDNLLCQPGGITLDGVALDIGKIDIPVYFLSAHDDHIAPWAATYLGARLFSGPVRFVVAGSGHIAGVINPPQNNKYGYRINEDPSEDLPADSGAWLEGATHCEGSWWPDWVDWIGKLSRRRTAARIPGEGGLPVIENAPGTYVSQRID